MIIGKLWWSLRAEERKLLRSSTLLERGPEGTSSMDGALAWRRETRSARDGGYGLKYSTRHQAKAAPRQPPLDWTFAPSTLSAVKQPPPSNGSRASCRPRIPREFNASSIIGNSRRLFHRFPLLLRLRLIVPSSIQPLCSLYFPFKPLFNCCSFLTLLLNRSYGSLASLYRPVRIRFWTSSIFYHI